MIYAIIILALVAIYQHFRISYIRNEWTELFEKMDDEIHKKTNLSYQKAVMQIDDKIIEHNINKEYKSDLRRWCVEQAIKLAPINGSIEGVVNSIESYIEYGYYTEDIKSPQERFDKIKYEKPDLSAIKNLQNKSK